MKTLDLNLLPIALALYDEDRDDNSLEKPFDRTTVRIVSLFLCAPIAGLASVLVTWSVIDRIRQNRAPH